MKLVTWNAAMRFRDKIEEIFSFHIDFLFASETILSRLSHFEIGTYERWFKFSDHVPLCAVFDNE